MFNRLSFLYWRYLTSPLKYAKHIGVHIGEDCFISTYNWGTEPYLIEIKNHVQITHGVSLHTHGGAHCVRRVLPSFDTFGKIIIQDWAYIGAYSQIMPGVTIGEGSLVAAGSVVTKSVEPFTVVGGNPAKFICTIEDYVNKNRQYNLGVKGMDYKRKKQLLLNTDDSLFIKK